LGDITVRNHLRRGRRSIHAGQEADHCRPISYQERDQIWRDALAREKASRKPGCENGELGKAALAVLRSLLFDFTNMKTGVCFPRVRTLQERLQPWFSRAAIFRALNRLEAAGMLVRVSRRMKNAGKVVQGASLYVFGRITEAEKTMVRKVGQLAKATARAIRPVLWSRSESQSASVPAENLIFRSKSGGKPALEVLACDRASIGLQMRELLASLKRRPSGA
jgi:predicted transcriptional regulator